MRVRRRPLTGTRTNATERAPPGLDAAGMDDASDLPLYLMLTSRQNIAAEPYGARGAYGLSPTKTVGPVSSYVPSVRPSRTRAPSRSLRPVPLHRVHLRNA